MVSCVEAARVRIKFGFPSDLDGCSVFDIEVRRVKPKFNILKKLILRATKIWLKIEIF